jgi:Reverse transcriptase (RNA-dependent DNA polymerase)
MAMFVCFLGSALPDACASFVDHGFVVRTPRSIHDPESIAFLCDYLGAGAWHRRLLSEGLVFDWIGSSPPPPYYEPNNKSALDHLTVLRETVATWLSAGFIEQVEQRPHCCNPLTVAVQYNALTDSVKHRPCIDLSRHVNHHILHSPAKLDDLSVAQQLIHPGDFMASFDLENQFFQVRLAPSMRRFMGFSVPYEDGSTRYFQFLVMPYGCKPAVSVVTRLLKPIKAFLHKLGIKLSVYVDDGRVSASSAAACRSQLYFALHVLHLAGWKVQWKKTQINPTTSLLHLGFVTDSVSMTYSITADKWTSFSTLVAAMATAAATATPVHIKSLATVLGKLVSFRRSHGPVVQVLSRHLQNTLGRHVATVGWYGDIILPAAAAAELPCLLAVLPRFNHRHIPAPDDDVHVASLADCRFSLPRVAPPPPPSSEFFGLRLDGSITVCPEPAASPSICFPELQAAVTYTAALTPRPPVIYWLTSSRIFVDLVLHGSLLPAYNDVVFNLLDLCASSDTDFQPVFSPSAAASLSAADARFALSQSTDEWSVDRLSLARVFLQFRFFPDVDCFSSKFNNVCPTFYSVSPQVGSSGVNFFAQRLQHGRRYFFCPLVKLLTVAFHRFLRTPGASAVFVFPDWPSAAFWATFHPGGRLHPAVTSRIAFSPRFFASNAAASLFTSGASIPMLALLVHS